MPLSDTRAAEKLANQLREWVERGDLAKLKKWAKDNDINAPIRCEDAFILVYAVRTLKYDAARLLLNLGANPNVTNNGGSTPLNLASGARKPDLPFIQLLLDKGADVTGKITVATPNARYTLWSPPLAEACAMGTVDVVKLLVNAGADVLAVDNHKVGMLENTLDSYYGPEDVSAKLEFLASSHPQLAERLIVLAENPPKGTREQTLQILPQVAAPFIAAKHQRSLEEHTPSATRRFSRL